MADAREERHHGFDTDIFTLGLTMVSKTGAVPIWCVAQCQILMDIFDALGMQADIGKEVLYEAMERQTALSLRLKDPEHEQQMQIIPDMAQLMGKLTAMEKESVKYHLENQSMCDVSLSWRTLGCPVSGRTLLE